MLGFETHPTLITAPNERALMSHNHGLGFRVIEDTESPDCVDGNLTY